MGSWGQGLETLYSPLQHLLTFGEFRVDDLLFRIPMIRVQIERDQPVANAVFLAVPALEVDLGQFQRSHALPGRHHWDEFRGGGRRWRRRCLPSFLPEAQWLRREVSLPVLDICPLSGSFHHKQLAPVSDEGYLDL